MQPVQTGTGPVLLFFFFLRSHVIRLGPSCSKWVLQRVGGRERGTEPGSSLGGSCCWAVAVGAEGQSRVRGAAWPGQGAVVMRDRGGNDSHVSASCFSQSYIWWGAAMIYLQNWSPEPVKFDPRLCILSTSLIINHLKFLLSLVFLAYLKIYIYSFNYIAILIHFDIHTRIILPGS